MALVIEDRVKETTTTTGAGALTLAGALNVTFRAFSAVMAVGDICYYALTAVDASGNANGVWECGFGTYSGANTLTRTTVTSGSSGAGTPVTLPVGTKHVWIDLTAQQIKQNAMGISGTYNYTFAGGL